MNAIRVLLVEDDPAYARLVGRMLSRVPTGSFETRACDTLEAAIELLRVDGPFDCILTDLGLPDAEGLGVVARLAAEAPATPIVVLSGQEGEALALRAVHEGADDYVAKNGASPEGLGRTVRYAAERGRSRAQILAGERRTRAIVELAHEPFIAVDAEGRVADWNRAAETCFGWTEREAVGAPLADRIAAAGAQADLTARLAEMIAGGAAARFDLRARRRDATELDVEVSATATGEEPEALHLFLRDVSARRAAEQAVKRSEGLYRTLIRHLPGTGALLYDRDLRFLKAEGSVMDEGPWTREHFEGRTVWEVMPDRAGDLAALMRATLDGQPHEYEAWSDDGAELFWIQNIPVRDDGGRVVAGLLVAQDVTRRQRSERQLEAQHAISEILAAAPPVHEGLPQLLAALGTHLGWDLGVAWQHDPTADGLRLTQSWYRHDVEGQTFVAECQAAPLPGGVDLAGRAWLTNRPVTLFALDEDGGFRRSRGAAAAALTCGVAVPLRSGGRSLGAFELFAREPRTLDEDVLSKLVTFGGQIGDYLERKRIEQDLADHAAHLATLSQATRDLSRVTDADAARCTVTDAVRRVAGARVAALAEKLEDGRVLVHAWAGMDHEDRIVDVATEPCAPAMVLMTGERLLVRDVRSSRAVPDWLVGASGCRSALFEPVSLDGEVVAVLCVLWRDPVEALAPRLGSTLGVLATEAAVALHRVLLVDELNAAARTDQLTGIANRRRWQEELPREIVRASRTGAPLSVVMLDVDHFKRYNDTFGHLAGDDLLVRLALAWSRELRATDLVARIGGEEFGVLLPDCDVAAAMRLAERLRSTVPEGASCSAGVACWDGTEAADQLVRRADTALYESKRGGRNRVTAADEGRTLSPDAAETA